MSKIENANEVLEQMNKVRQVRQYKPEPVPVDVVDQLLEIARWTGSSRNTQPWHFIVVDDKDKLYQISQLRTPINWVADASLAIAIVLDGENPTGEAYDEGRVTERLLVAAHMLGYGGGTAWYGDESLQEKGKEILGIPKERTARSVVAIGHTISAKDPRPSPAASGRRPLSEIVSQNTFGQPRAR
jgi:nitroreductase